MLPTAIPTAIRDTLQHKPPHPQSSISLAFSQHRGPNKDNLATGIARKSSVKSNNNAGAVDSYPTPEHQHSSRSTSPSPMIGPSPTVYHQQEYSANHEADNSYQHWRDSYSSQQQQFPAYQYGRTLVEEAQSSQFTFEAYGGGTSVSQGGHPNSITYKFIPCDPATDTSSTPIAVPSNPFRQGAVAAAAAAEPNNQQHMSMFYQQAQASYPHQHFNATTTTTNTVMPNPSNLEPIPYYGTNQTYAVQDSLSVSPAGSIVSSSRLLSSPEQEPRREWTVPLTPDSSPPNNGLPRTSKQTLARRVTVSGATTSPAKRKRPRKEASTTKKTPSSGAAGAPSDSSSDEESDAGGIRVGVGGLGVQGNGSGLGGSKTPGACKHCKKLKMKCDIPKGGDTCVRCKATGRACIVEVRKPRIPANKREYLLAQLKQKDAVIESLLKQIHNPYIATPMSIASYVTATSPSDSNNRDIIESLSRLKSSLKTADGKKEAHAFSNSQGVDEDSDGGTSQAAQIIPAGDETGHDDKSVDRSTALPDVHVPMGLLAHLSLSGKKGKKNAKGKTKDKLNDEDFDDTNVGPASEIYFEPGPATDLNARAILIEKHSPPEIVLHGLVTPEDVEKLFEIFYENINPFVSLLDPVLHTPASTFSRCPFLFTVVCAISSRYYTKKSGIYPIAMHFAKHSAANALVDGWKSVELCQAYILMSIYAVPARRWEEDRSWLYTGLAIRLATDLNLHQPSFVKPQSEKHEREMLNKARVWLICCNLDRSTAAQFGKPSTIKEHYILRHAKDWYKKSKYNHPYDIHLCGYSELLQIVAKFHGEIFSDPSSPTGLNKKVNFRSITLAHDECLNKFQEEWSVRFVRESDMNGDKGCALRCSLMPYLVGYSRLVMFSFGFQEAFRRGLQPEDDIFFQKCLFSAKSVINDMIEGLIPGGYMRFAPDGHFVFASFASAFLLKLLRPEFSKLLSTEEEAEILKLISRLIQALSSPKVAIDDKHTPKLYARFLATLLARHRREGATRQRTTSATNNFEPPSSAPRNDVQILATRTDEVMTQIHRVSGPPQSSDVTMNFFSDPSGPNVYTPEVTFADGSSPFNINDILMENNILSEEEILATMQSIKNPSWWQNMMLPGFSWPDSQSPSPPSNNASIPPFDPINFSYMSDMNSS